MACDLQVELHWGSQVQTLPLQPGEGKSMRDLVIQVARNIGVRPVELRDYRFYWNNRALTWHARLIDLPGRADAVALVLRRAKHQANGVNGATHPSRGELRAEVRHPCALESSCSTGQRETGWPAKVRDLSAGGVGLVLGRWFAKGAVLEVQIDQPDGTGTRRLLARVMHVSKLDDGQWMIGCSLASKLSAETVQALVGGNG